jgi:K+-sensing histidine kinase KdpD
VVELRGSDDATRTAVGDVQQESARARWLLLAWAVLAPIATALLLTPWRDRLAAADDALILVVVIVAVATSGHRWAAATCALVCALSFDFFLTRPYNSLRITRTSDLVTELLLLVVGLAVGDLAARGRTHRTAASQGRRHIELLHSVTEMAASGRDPDEMVRVAADELCRLLTLRTCTFSVDDGGVAARVQPDGEVRIGDVAWSTDDLGLPHRGVDLPVRGNGAVLGHFVLMPVPGTPVAGDVLLVAVAIADQVGAALAAAPGWVPGAR